MMIIFIPTRQQLADYIFENNHSVQACGLCSIWTLDTAPCVFVLVLMNNFYLVLTLMSGWLGATSK